MKLVLLPVLPLLWQVEKQESHPLQMEGLGRQVPLLGYSPLLGFSRLCFLSISPVGPLVWLRKKI